MHSRIIELSREKINKEERIDEYDYCDNGFIGTVADYVTSCDRIYAIEWFADFLKYREIITEFDTDKIVFADNVKEKFFKDRFDEFKKLTRELTFEEFAQNDDYALYKIKQCMSDKYGFYVHCGGNYYTIDDFIRYYVQDGDVWYIGGTIDYHF